MEMEGGRLQPGIVDNRNKMKEKSSEYPLFRIQDCKRQGCKEGAVYCCPARMKDEITLWDKWHRGYKKDRSRQKGEFYNRKSTGLQTCFCYYYGSEITVRMILLYTGHDAQKKGGAHDGGLTGL